MAEKHGDDNGLAPSIGTAVAVGVAVLLVAAFYLGQDWLALAMCELGITAPGP